MSSSRVNINSSKHINRSLRSSFVQREKGDFISNEGNKNFHNQDVPLIDIKKSVRYHT